MTKSWNSVIAPRDYCSNLQVTSCPNQVTRNFETLNHNCTKTALGSLLFWIKDNTYLPFSVQRTQSLLSLLKPFLINIFVAVPRAQYIPAIKV